MTFKAPDADITYQQDLVRSLVDTIKDLRHDIEALKDKAKTGGDIDSKAVATLLGELNKAVIACANAETRLNESRSKQAGIAHGGYALDMGRLRTEIGCKLDRLRRCGAPGEVSE